MARRGAPTTAQRKKKQRQANEEKNKLIEQESPTVAACLNYLLIEPTDTFVSSVISKESFIDECHLIVNHDNLDKSIIPLLSKIESIGIKISQYFTLDGIVSLNIILDHIKRLTPDCQRCAKELNTDNQIVCSKCKKAFHPKCVNVSYVPKKKSWFCSEACRPE